MSESRRLPCPPWCAGHDADDINAIHCSEWRSWQENDSPVVELQMVRYDEPGAPYPDCIGMIDFAVRITPNPHNLGQDGFPVEGYIEANAMRRLAAWLLNETDEADPYKLNGEPLEWHASERREVVR
jgi:hypothetical protein